MCIEDIGTWIAVAGQGDYLLTCRYNRCQTRHNIGPGLLKAMAEAPGWRAGKLFGLQRLQWLLSADEERLA